MTGTRVVERSALRVSGAVFVVEEESMERPLRQRLLDMLLIKSLVRSGAITREQASIAVQQGRGEGRCVPHVLSERGWVSPERLKAALEELGDTMHELEGGAAMGR